MAKKKEKDRHKSGFMVRLPEEYRKPLESRKRKTGAPYTVTLQQMIERDFRRNGDDCPKNWPESS